MKRVLTFMALASFPAWAADALFDSPLGADEICASRPDMCKSKTRPHAHKNAQVTRKKNRDLDFSDFDDVPGKKQIIKPASTDNSLEKDLDALAAQDKAKRKIKARKKSTKARENESLDDFWKRDADGGMEDDVALLDIEREPDFVKPVTKETPKKVVRRRISFESYMNSNSDNAALSSGYGRRQDAFEQPDRPAILAGASSSSVPIDSGPAAGSDSNAAAASSGGSPGGGQSVRENQP